MFTVVKAEREAKAVTVAMIGQSGSGKTYSALLTARGMVGPEGKTTIIDTEGRRALIYADDPDIGGFHHIDFGPPYSSDRMKEAVRTAFEDGANAIIIDSASHEHEAEGGLLDYADAEGARLRKAWGKDPGYALWKKPKMAHSQFMLYASRLPCHVIFCYREHFSSETSFKNGKQTIVEVVTPIWEKNTPFEMELIVRLNVDTHEANARKISKPFRQHFTDGEVLTAKHGAKLVEVASEGKALDYDVEGRRASLRDWAHLGTDELRNRSNQLNEINPGIFGMLKEAYPTLMDELKETAGNADQTLGSDDDAGDTEETQAREEVGGVQPATKPSTD